MAFTIIDGEPPEKVLTVQEAVDTWLYGSSETCIGYKTKEEEDWTVLICIDDHFTKKPVYGFCDVYYLLQGQNIVSEDLYFKNSSARTAILDAVKATSIETLQLFKNWKEFVKVMADS